MQATRFFGNVVCRVLLALALTPAAWVPSPNPFHSRKVNSAVGLSSEALSPMMEWMERPWHRSAGAVREWIRARQEIQDVASWTENGVRIQYTVRFLREFNSAGIKRKLKATLRDAKRQALLRSQTLRPEDLSNFEIAYDFDQGVKRGWIRYKSFGPYRAVYNRLREVRPYGSFKALNPADHPTRKPFNRQSLKAFPSRARVLGQELIQGRKAYYLPNKFP